MKVAVVSSREMIVPADSNQLHLLNPFKLSLYDQLIPANYVSVVYFYPKSTSDHHHHPTQISSRLKESLSKALNQFYPLSGRTVNNCSIDSYDEGVPFVEARINGSLSDYLDAFDVDELNKLFAFEPFRPLPDTNPLLAVQLNMFDCGGISLALSFSHKIFDLSTKSAFLKCWSSFSRGSDGDVVYRPDLLEASSRYFPPMDRISPDTLSTLERFWFKEGRYKTRNFVFDATALKALASKAKSKKLERPSRSTTLTAFIWKHAMLASRSVTGTVKPSVMGQAVDFRPKMKSSLADYSIGNLFGSAGSTYYNSGEKDIELHELAYITRQAVENFNVEAQQGEKGFKAFCEGTKQLSESVSKGDVEFYGFSSWLNYGIHQQDFGWGKPIWYGMPGIVYPTVFNNYTFLRDVGDEKAVEAWITLDPKCMDVLERDPEFRAFASLK